MLTHSDPPEVNDKTCTTLLTFASMEDNLKVMCQNEESRHALELALALASQKHPHLYSFNL